MVVVATIEALEARGALTEARGALTEARGETISQKTPSGGATATRSRYW